MVRLLDGKGSSSHMKSHMLGWALGSCASGGGGPASKPCKRLEAESQEGACVVPMRLCVWAEETAVRREIVKRTVTLAHVVLVGT